MSRRSRSTDPVEEDSEHTWLLANGADDAKEWVYCGVSLWTNYRVINFQANRQAQDTAVVFRCDGQCCIFSVFSDSFEQFQFAYGTIRDKISVVLAIVAIFIQTLIPPLLMMALGELTNIFSRHQVNNRVYLVDDSVCQMAHTTTDPNSSAITNATEASQEQLSKETLSFAWMSFIVTLITFIAAFAQVSNANVTVRHALYYRWVSTRICQSVPVSVLVPKKIFSSVRDQYQYSPSTDGTSTSTSTTNIDQIWPRNLKFSRKKIGFQAENYSNLEEQLLSLKLKFEKKNLTYLMAVNLFTWFCSFFCFGTGTDWPSTYTISISTESVLEIGPVPVPVPVHQY
jgi:hypothetical protein